MIPRVGVALVASLALLCWACGPDDAPADSGLDANVGGDAGSIDGGVVLDAGPAPLVADAGADRYAVVGELVVLDGSASTGAASYEWSFGDGRSTEPSAEPVASATYDAPGRYRAVLTVRDEAGNRRTDGVTITVTRTVVGAAPRSAPMQVVGDLVIVVSHDSDELVAFRVDGTSVTEAFRRGTSRGPRTIAPFEAGLAVACTEAGVVEVHPLAAAGTAEIVSLPRGSRPFGVVGLGDALYVTLQATGQVARIERDAGGTLAETLRYDVIPDARGIAALHDGRLLVSRWRSPDERGEIAALETDLGDFEIWPLAYDPQPGSDTASGGVPSYLDQVLVSPTADLVAVPSLQASIGEGLFRSPRPLTHQTTVRAVLSFLDPATGAETSGARKHFDDRGFAAAGVFSSHGDYLFLAMPGNRSVERFDVLRRTQAGSAIDVGFAPDAVALSADDTLLFVHASLSRELVVYDATSFGDGSPPIARLPMVTSEPLAPEILRGKQVFHDSADPRITRDGYIACAHCHLDGVDDHRTWDFTDRGEGLRNTIALVGHAGAAHGPIHWSGNFDEVQDFEHDIRSAFLGAGLMTDTDFHTGTRDTTLGDPKGGVSADLDALAAYVTSLDAYPESPFRAPDGSLPTAAVRGRAIFERASVGCTSCHSGPRLTDSRFEPAGTPVLHDVGTLGAGSGGRLGGPLDGIDTPTLHGVFATAPYLHDGSAATLLDVLTTRNATDGHGVTSTLTAAERDDLVAYLRCLDGSGT